MSKHTATLLPLLALALVLSGCDLAEGIIKFGFWTGVVVVFVIAAAIWLVARRFRR